jgi:phenylacetate-coenzyme A ligase PaaK-like adenylate-forming protein
MASRLTALADVGLFRIQRLPVSAPMRDLVSALHRHRPEVLGGYASTLALLATAQLDGHLDIAPAMVLSSSEPLTDAHRQRVRDAWGVEPFDAYATTETGPLAQECQAHQGRHVFEDTVILEVEKDRVLLTNLINRGFPIIRFAVEDLVALEPGPCPCGRKTARITSIAGRVNDVLHLPSRDDPAEPVAVHPSAWTPITALPAVADADICFDGSRLDVRVVPRSEAPASRSDAVEQATSYVARTLRQLQLDHVPVRVSGVTSLPRTAAGKRQLVRNTAIRP